MGGEGLLEICEPQMDLVALLYDHLVETELFVRQV